jgi:hypothetical protein
VDTIAELEARLAAAQDAEKQVIQRFQDGEPGADEEWLRLSDTILEAERALAAARGEEHALLCRELPRWCVGAPMPHVLARNGHVKLVYILSEADPAWDGTYTTIASADDVSPLAIVDFPYCEAVKFGGPNDEVLHGHPLHGKGLQAYRAHTVVHSHWIAELQQINSVHSMYNPDHYTSLRHYLLVFHDDMFECLARSAVIEIVRDKLTDVLRRLV